jgi:hypothetical protein
MSGFKRAAVPDLDKHIVATKQQENIWMKIDFSLFVILFFQPPSVTCPHHPYSCITGTETAVPPYPVD